MFTNFSDLRFQFIYCLINNLKISYVDYLSKLTTLAGPMSDQLREVLLY